MSSPYLPSFLQVRVGAQCFYVAHDLVAGAHARIRVRALDGFPYCVAEATFGKRGMQALDLRRRLGARDPSWEKAEDAAAVIVHVAGEEVALLVDGIEREAHLRVLDVADTLGLVVPALDSVTGALGYVLDVPRIVSEPFVAAGLCLARARLAPLGA